MKTGMGWRLWVTALLWVALPRFAWADPAGSAYTDAEAKALFDEANAAYARGDAQTAAESYERLLRGGRGGPDVLYNLGTVYLGLGKMGEAVLALERAWKAGDRSEDLEAQLALARTRQLDRVVGGSGEELPQRLARATSGEGVTWGFLAAYLVTSLLLLRRKLWPQKTGAGWWGLVVVSGLASGVLGILLAAHCYTQTHVQEAVVLAPTLAARTAPEPGASSAFELHAGLKVRVLERSGAFQRVRLGNGLTGWVERTGMADL